MAKDITEHSQQRRIYPQSWPGDAPQEFGIKANSVKIKRVDLAAARVTPFAYDFGGSILWAVRASSLGALCMVSLGDMALSSDPIPFQQGMFVRGLRFSRIYVTNTAQADEWIEFLTAVEGPDQIQIENPGASLLQLVLAKATVFETAVDVTLNFAAAAVQVLAANPNRRAAIFCSLGVNPNLIRIGDAATTMTRGIELAPGESVTIETTEAIFADCEVANCDLSISWTED